MTRWQEVQELFEMVIDESPDRRASILADSCGGDDELRREVERLLKEDAATAEDFLDPIAPSVVSNLLAATDAVPIEHREIGGYRVIDVLGAGGHGTVYLAEQLQPRRTVALKVVKTGLRSGDLERRLRYEAEVLAHLRHPGIAQVYASGVHRNGDDEAPAPEIPWFAMEYVEDAQDLLTYTEELELGPRDVASLFASVCEAVHHGHQKGVIHRDLKPTNILVDGEGRPKIIDFGLARALDSAAPWRDMETDSGQLLGTLRFMSPEQLTGEPEDVDARSDIFSLGVVLYELTCGHPPFNVSGLPLSAAIQGISEGAAAPMGPDVPAELGWIVERALEKNPARRYASAAEFAADLRRYERREPVLAGSPGVAYRMLRFAGRHRTLVIGVVSVVVALTVGLVKADIERGKADRARILAEQEAKRSRVAMNFISGVLGSMKPQRLGRDVTMLEVLSAAGSQVDHRFADDLLQRATVHHVISKSLLELGKVELGSLHARRAYDETRGALPEDDLFALSVAQTYCRALYWQADYSAAEPLARDLLILQESVSGVDAVPTLRARADLASVLRAIRQPSEAVQLYAENLEYASRIDPSDYRFLLSNQKNFALALIDLGDLDEAEIWLDRAYESSLEWFGDEDIDTVQCLAERGLLLSLRGEYKEAREYFERSAEGYLKIYGEGHPRVLETLGNLSVSDVRLGEIEQAIATAEDLVRQIREKRGDRHPALIPYMRNLAGMYMSGSRGDDAVALYRESFDISSENYGDPHPTTLSAANRLGHALLDLRRIDDARHVFGDVVIRVGADAEEPTLSHRLHALQGLARIEAIAERWVESEKIYRDLLESCRRHLPDGDEITTIVLNGVAWTLVNQERYSEALPYMEEVVADTLEGDPRIQPRRRLLKRIRASL